MVALQDEAENPLLSHFKDRRRKVMLASVVMVAVCSLTLSLATRYYFPVDGSSQTVKTFKTRTSPEANRQRLNKNAANWLPPVLVFTDLEAPNFYPKFAPAGSPIPTLLLEQSLYNRPPPTALILT